MAGIKGRLARLRTAESRGREAGRRPGAEKGERGEMGEMGPSDERAFLPGWRKVGAGLFERILTTSLRVGEEEKGSFDSRPFLLRQKIGMKNVLAAGGTGVPGDERRQPGTEVPVAFSELSFFDLETTGLSGGAGTLAFLAAVGYFSDQALRIHQLFIDDFPGERLFLERLIQLLSLRPNIVSFNGASFDLPLLRTRCVLNGLAVPDYFHIDALHLSRRLWKKTIGPCSLQSLEESILGAPRQDDVPGFLIPRLWLDFIKAGTRTGESLSLMERVVEHNSLDVRSLARLFLVLERLFSMPDLRWRELRADPVALGKTYFVLGMNDSAFDLLYSAGEYGNEEALAFLAGLYRRSRDYDACRKVLGRLEGRSFPVCIEMAKCFEHVEKDPLRALEIAQTAALLAQAGVRRLSASGKERLEKRIERLKRKLAMDRP